jgi:hypothetical protein
MTYWELGGEFSFMDMKIGSTNLMEITVVNESLRPTDRADRGKVLTLGFKFQAHFSQDSNHAKSKFDSLNLLTRIM